MMENKISMNESIEAGAPSIKYDQGDIRMGQGGDEQGRQVAAQIWEQMEQEQRITILEQQIRDIMQQQKNLLEYIKELSLIITETRIDNSAK